MYNGITVIRIIYSYLMGCHMRTVYVLIFTRDSMANYSDSMANYSLYHNYLVLYCGISIKFIIIIICNFRNILSNHKSRLIIKLSWHNHTSTIFMGCHLRHMSIISSACIVPMIVGIPCSSATLHIHFLRYHFILPMILLSLPHSPPRSALRVFGSPSSRSPL